MRKSSVLAWLTVLSAAGVAIGVSTSVPLAQTPAFRSAVALVAVDVHVVSASGQPVLDLQPQDFTVTFAGRERRVASMNLVRHVAMASGRSPSTVTVLPDRRDTATTVMGRDVVLAVDSGSFDAASWQRVFETVRIFVGSLSIDDRLGLYVYPEGPNLTPSADHGVALRGLRTLVVRGRPLQTRFNLRPLEVVDITAEMVRLRSPASAVRRNVDAGADTPTVQSVHARECQQDSNCPAQILMDASSAAHELEGRMLETVAGLKGMMTLLREWPGRKTVVLLTGGLVVSDRPGGQPEGMDISRVLGQGIAATNAAIYTIHVDSGYWSGYSAVRKSLSRSGVDSAREVKMQSQWLEQFSDAAGGALLRVTDTTTEVALRRVLAETEAHYILGVEPTEADRDGQLRSVSVRVNRSGASIRSRMWVIMPKGRGGNL